MCIRDSINAEYMGKGRQNQNFSFSIIPDILRLLVHSSKTPILLMSSPDLHPPHKTQVEPLTEPLLMPSQVKTEEMVSSLSLIDDAGFIPLNNGHVSPPEHPSAFKVAASPSHETQIAESHGVVLGDPEYSRTLVLKIQDSSGSHYAQNVEPNFQGFITFSSAAIQSALCYVIEIVTSLVSIYFMGQVSDTETLGALGLGVSWVACFGYTVTYSINSGLECLASQAYGARDYSLMISYLHKTIIAQITALLPLSVLAFFAEDLMILVGFEVNLARIAGTFCIYSIPSFYFLAIYDCVKAYLHAQGVFDLQLYVAIYAVTMHCIVCYLLIVWLRLGIKGAAFANAITDGLLAITIIPLTIKKGHWKKKWRWFNKLSFSNWGIFLKSLFSVGGIMYLGWLAFELYTCLLYTSPSPRDQA
eukprot:TRINITY_DN13739_c0_g1_i1.p1 TRINITY_DN13739_c0_g1~~TRINITY_DN13739_c0_g1_i1.p1  ORF type:complete len:437 (-),score=27.17 TRINITY_DN13739_c0_g1_i1:35-1285(-)